VAMHHSAEARTQVHMTMSTQVVVVLIACCTCIG
jgi:hypothetical protein